MSELLSDRRILVVEDEMLILMMIEDMLADLGCAAVTSAATVADALKQIGTGDFDAAMLDMNLGGDHTREVADALIAAGVPFFFSTGYSIHDVRGDYQKHPILKKPFSDVELAEMLKSVLKDQKT